MFKKKVNDSKASENQKTDASATPIAGQPQPLGERDPITLEAKTQGGPVSCIGSGMSIVGNIECGGPAVIFGFIQGETRATDLVIREGAQITGNVLAWEVTIGGHVQGTIRADRVKLQNGGVVEGEIFHRSLSMDESSLFEGRWRRVENPVDAPSRVDAKDTLPTLQKHLETAQSLQSKAPKGPR